MAKKDIKVYEGPLFEYERMPSIFNGELMLDSDLISEIMNEYKGKNVRLTIEVLEESR